MSDPDRRPSVSPVRDAPPPGEASAPAPADPIALGEAASLLAEKLARLATAVQTARDHLEHDPERTRAELERMRDALDALGAELAHLSHTR